jgi:hypothetical protein
VDETSLELNTKKGYLTTLNESILPQTKNDEILHFNYEGLYGISTIYRFLQEGNPSAAVPWVIQFYKVNLLLLSYFLYKIIKQF